MTDRELLELAAKAAGLRINFHPCASYAWNPLTDDGDALRLAVKLEIDLTFYTEREACTYAQTKHLLGYGTDGCASYQAHEYYKELHGADPHAATRRAIVRAAAAIGQAMP